VGTVSITVPTDYSGSFSGSAVANTNEGSSAADGFSVSVSAEADVTVTANDVSGAETDAPVNIALALSHLITDADGSETLSNVVVTFTGAPAGMTATGGSLVDNGGGSYTLTVLPANVGTVSITVPTDYSGSFSGSAVANTNEGSSAADGFSVSVVATNDPPVARPDTIYVSNNTNGIVIPVNSLLGNDSDIDGLALTLSLTPAQIAAATGITNLTLNSNGTITFNSTNASSGSFSYTLSDSAGGTTTGSVTINIVTTTGTGNTVDLSALSYEASYIDGKNGGDALTGNTLTPAGDLFIGGAGDDTLIGGAGDDVLRGGSGDDSLNGGAGTDLLDYSDVSGPWSLTLGASGAGSAAVNGTDAYSNTEGIIGGSGNNTLIGNTANNVFRGGAGDDTINGGAGTDLLDFSEVGTNWSFTLGASGTGSAAVNGTDAYLNMEGIIGGSGNNTLAGNADDNVLKGGGGNDTLSGDNGNDTLVGGAGADSLTGGAGSDTFAFVNGDAASVDTIADLQTGVGGDLLDVSSLLIGYTGSNLGQWVGLRESGGNTIVSIDRDGTGGLYAAQDIAVLQGLTGLDLNTLLSDGNIDATAPNTWP
jgi:Ca2+-binding RTX toxin-like protein